MPDSFINDATLIWSLLPPSGIGTKSMQNNIGTEDPRSSGNPEVSQTHLAISPPTHTQVIAELVSFFEHLVEVELFAQICCRAKITVLLSDLCCDTKLCT